MFEYHAAMNLTDTPQRNSVDSKLNKNEEKKALLREKPQEMHR
jgi:hypothetical protein